ncbi:MAG TPA: hypothetical protein DCE42_05690 [Myxococcales bacterium]|nr:hypothetical protein [Deltaproteobacteria bacterium]MBU47939.1 hypothetical protein [Deltaproteobacteria bacterium]HAA54225.1 hypothetical protein [Myxococcales bacterium]|tara:strand:+ start:10040 stop:10672 length:633 start_codon:yes stop_codon:yes gene_type:complete
MSKKKHTYTLSLGPEIVKFFLPHRQPFLMVDRIESYTRKPIPSMECTRQLSINEPVFAGHFPQVSIFPGAYILEGLCQTCQLLCTFILYEEAFDEHGVPKDTFLDALKNVEMGYRFEPGFQADAAQQFFEAIEEKGTPKLGVTASTQMKFIHPVFAGETLRLRARFQRKVDQLWRYEVEAESNNRIVSKGVVTAAIMEQPLLDILSRNKT